MIDGEETLIDVGVVIADWHHCIMPLFHIAVGIICRAGCHSQYSVYTGYRLDGRVCIAYTQATGWMAESV
jgi:hypothetical protein